MQSVVAFELKTMERVEAVTAKGKVDFPYIPGLLSFRESPILLKAFEKIKSTPDVVILDAQGIAHPRGIDLNTPIDLVLKSCRGHRLPEPARKAHKLAKKTATGKE